MVAFAGGAVKERLERDLLSSAAAPAGGHDELPARGFVTVVDETDAKILCTGHVLAPGDEFIAEDDRLYRVTEVSGGKARCRLEVAAQLPAQAAIPSRPDAQSPAAGGSVGIYHTHSDESYVPTEGSESVETLGGVVKVGAALRDALRNKSVAAVHDSTSHAPHDAMAYARSRRTAMRLVSQARAALFDVHRDAAPAGEYSRQVAGRRVSQVMLVVGRQNPKYRTNLEFARRLKAVVDKSHPGLVKGILIAGGAFNQDLSDRALLLEVGADSNSRTEAEHAVQLLADDIPKVVGATTTPGGGISGTAGAQGRSAARAIGGILIVVAVGLGGYLVLSTGSLREAVSKLRKLGGRELANFLGGRGVRSRGGSEPGRSGPRGSGSRDPDASASDGPNSTGGEGRDPM
jgi:stage II sporulation protein P